MLSTLITAGAIACGALVDSTETNPNPVDSDNLTTPEKVNEQANCDSPANYDSSDCSLSSGYGQTCNSFAGSDSVSGYGQEDSD
jgi:hypothetical protein